MNKRRWLNNILTTLRANNAGAHDAERQYVRSGAEHRNEKQMTAPDDTEYTAGDTKHTAGDTKHTAGDKKSPADDKKSPADDKRCPPDDNSSSDDDAT